MTKTYVLLFVSVFTFSVFIVNAEDKKVINKVEYKKWPLNKSNDFKKVLKTNILIESKLKENPDALIFSVDGLCCNTCAIGIGKKVSKVKSVDVKKLPKGVHLDRKYGLLTVAIKKDEKVDVSQLAIAIRKAGYKPTNVYKLEKDGKVNKSPIASKKNKK